MVLVQWQRPSIPKWRFMTRYSESQPSFISRYLLCMTKQYLTWASSLMTFCHVWLVLFGKWVVAMVTGEKTISYLLDNLLCFSNVRSVKYEVGTMFFGYGLHLFGCFQFFEYSNSWAWVFRKCKKNKRALRTIQKLLFFLVCRNEEKAWLFSTVEFRLRAKILLRV